MVTIAPVGLLFLLGITFVTGARRPGQGRASTPVNNTTRGTNVSTSNANIPTTVADTSATRTKMWFRRKQGIIVADDPRRMGTASKSWGVKGSSFFSGLSASFRNKRGNAIPEETTATSAARSRVTYQRSLRGVWRAGPGDGSSPEQVISDGRGGSKTLLAGIYQCWCLADLGYTRSCGGDGRTDLPSGWHCLISCREAI